MNLICFLGIHKWNKCKCTKCNKVRDMLPTWEFNCEKCSVCESERENAHDWSINCEKCSVCESERENAHDWSDNCEKCSVCVMLGTDKHIHKNDICIKCGRGVFVDKRDKRIYKVRKIGNQLWMDEDLKFNLENNCWIYNGSHDSVIENGYLYNWESAINACPPGWHLPSDDEWKELETYFGMDLNEADKMGYRGEKLNIGSILITGNYKKYSNLTGKNNFQLNLGGYRLYDQGTFHHLNYSASYWTSTKNEKGDGCYRYLRKEISGIYRIFDNPHYGFSVRCIKD